MRNYRIEEMQEKHLDQIVAIEKMSFPTPWNRQHLCSELYNNDFARYYVAVVRKVVAGYAGMWVILDEAHITNIAVHPQYRGQKLGRALLTELERRAVAAGVERMTLEVRPSNREAQSLYRHAGFAPVGLRKGYYTDTREDAIIMWKDLVATPAGR
ncbi:MAG: ribosomal-protein-alanine N-acetyltransferase [Clostridia bacterium]|nr:MAG: ribosomal-protein-alanine N-acetyltransferase [Clostridia bacterium]